LQEIKKAYRKQSLVHHPDKGGDEEKFKEVISLLCTPRMELTCVQVSEAYAILSDPQKKRRYDLGEDDDDHGGIGGGGFHHPFAHGGFGGSPFGGMDGGIDLEELLGGGRRRGFRSQGFGF
jgi:DnaJ family protein C protein 7